MFKFLNARTRSGIVSATCNPATTANVVEEQENYWGYGGCCVGEPPLFYSQSHAVTQTLTHCGAAKAPSLLLIYSPLTHNLQPRIRTHQFKQTHTYTLSSLSLSLLTHRRREFISTILLLGGSSAAAFSRLLNRLYYCSFYLLPVASRFHIAEVFVDLSNSQRIAMYSL